MKLNYQLELEKIISNLNTTPTLLLHSCCGPCSSYVLKYLSDYFKITVIYYNPNIYPLEEYNLRLQEQLRLIREMKLKNPVSFLESSYDPEHFFSFAKDMALEKEGGNRCYKCYQLRMEETVKQAKKNKFDYFTTTLSVSPYKNSDKINEIGQMLEELYQVRYLYSDFKKKNGYQESIKLSKEYNLYRQNYCGCVYSKNERISDFSVRI